LTAFRRHLQEKRSTFLGYQATEDLNYEDELSWLLNMHINNIGDPFKEGNFSLNSKVMERKVLDYFADLWHAQRRQPDGTPIDENSYWGHVLTMGSTEGNIYALWNARDYLGGKALIVDTPAAGPDRAPRLMLVQAPAPAENENADSPVVFYSEETHYSFTKGVRIVDIPTFFELGTAKYPGACPVPGSGGVWPTEVPSLGGARGNGEIDIRTLAILVEFFAAKGHPIFVNLNYGSTFKCAYDNVQKAIDVLMPIFERHHLVNREVEYAPGRKDIRHGFWFHVDGALGSAYAPFLRMAEDETLPGMPDADQVPVFDFALPYVFSLVMSGHKWMGAPQPCGVYMTKVKYQLQPPDDPQYIGSYDTTIAGSRNAFSAAVLWDFLARHSYKDQIALAAHSQQLAAYVKERLDVLSLELGLDLWVARGPAAITVRFRQPSEKYVTKYSLSLETLESDPGRHLAHIYLMPGIEQSLVDEFIEDLGRPDAYPPDHVAATERERGPDRRTLAGEPGARTLARVPISGRGFR